jgi:hypothetical protein
VNRREFLYVLGGVGALKTGSVGYEWASFASDPRDYIQPHHTAVEEQAEAIDGLPETAEMDVELTYDRDIENFKPAPVYLEDGAGDCIAYDQEVITCNGIKTVKQIRVGDEVLSYDFENDDYVYKAVLNKWDKGKKQVKKLSLGNGKSVQVTEDHPMLRRHPKSGYKCIKNRESNDYIKEQLSELSFENPYSKVPVAQELQIETKDRDELTPLHAFVFGHFCAEGWTEAGYRTRTSGYELQSIKPILEKLDIQYSENRNGNDVPTVEFLTDNWFVEIMHETKEDSFNITLPEWFLRLPENKIKMFVDGYFVGDGHWKKRENNKWQIFSTSSQQLAEDLGFMLNRLGRPTYEMKCENHQGVGDQPIYRLHTNPNSAFNNDVGHEGISDVGVRPLTDAGMKHTYDFEVKDTHNFFFKNGLLVHNCEDVAITAASILENKEIPWKMVFEAGHTETHFYMDGDYHRWHSGQPKNPEERDGEDFDLMFDLDDGWNTYDEDWA